MSQISFILKSFCRKCLAFLTTFISFTLKWFWMESINQHYLFTLFSLLSIIFVQQYKNDVHYYNHASRVRILQVH